MLVHHHVPTLAMLLACAHAFNAYVRDGSVNFRTDSSGNQRRSAGANGRYVSKGSSYYDRSWQEIESNRRRSVRVHAGLGKRKNEVNVVPSYEPTEPNSMAIDQDGTDLSYFSTVRFGSSGKKLRLLLDTAGANTWIMGSSCKSEACILHDSFGEADSSTLSMTEKPWKLNYGAGGVSGLIANDKVSFAGIEITMDFGLASTVSDEFRGNPFDGILGLGRPNTGELDVPPLLDILRDQKVLKANTFGINLQRQSDNSNDGAIIFGDWNRSRVDGDLNWISTSPQSKLWEVPVDDAVIDSKPAGFPGKRAIIDTGSSFLLLPPDDAKKLFDAFPGSQSNGDQYRLPCSSGTVLEFKLGGEAYDMSPEDYLGPPSDGGMCESNILARQTFHPDQWILGASFLRNVYTVFDYDQNRVGFGKKVTAIEAKDISAVSKDTTAPGSSAVNESSTSSQISSIKSTAVNDIASTTDTRASSANSPVDPASVTEAVSASPTSAGHSLRLSWTISSGIGLFLIFTFLICF